MNTSSTIARPEFVKNGARLVLLVIAAFGMLECSVAFAGAGTDAVELMKYYYYRTVKNCGSTRPAYLCSGLMLRGTQHSKDYQVWNPSPTSVENKGVSFSYLRDDAKYDRLGLLNYNGYVLTPNDDVKKPQQKRVVNCFFPLDAWTDRRTEGGCGDNADTKNITEAMCDSINVNTAGAWIKNYNSVGKERPSICGFDVREDRGTQATNNFYEGIKAMDLLNDVSFSRQNEIRVKTWDQGKPLQLSALAFIYTRREGLADAQADQEDMYKATQRWIPVIYLNLPDTPAADATFSYKASDQAIKEQPSSNCGPYIQKAEWKKTFVKEVNKDVAQLVVTPTKSCGRNFSEAQTDAAFAELANKYRGNSDWAVYDDTSMKRQFLCLRLQYPGNETWNLEPFRPYVSAEQAISARCNPVP
ncbi:MAG: DUF2599 domain-containing protein [Pseudomonas sp.]|uniref:DUF2599 domain-containing protein n=1 Tax=Pseudomonas sp. TaxID=306 RepID=UPI00239D27F7|nr:DUF2599 domain-containing protein [Pseudomonas sp.]MDE1196264.1 DUF2599 domain-containing protein [Pseudomonas sp.]